jgi:hypothetical protein
MQHREHRILGRVPVGGGIKQEGNQAYRRFRRLTSFFIGSATPTTAIFRDKLLRTGGRFGSRRNSRTDACTVSISACRESVQNSRRLFVQSRCDSARSLAVFRDMPQVLAPLRCSNHTPQPFHRYALPTAQAC